MSLLPDALRSAEAKPSILAQTGTYLWKHRNKVAVGGAVCAAAIAVYAYYSVSNKTSETEEENLLHADIMRRNAIVKKPGDRSRMLLRIRKQFDFAIRQFLPTMHTRVLEVVDVSSSIRKIKELRAGNTEADKNSSDFVNAEAALWDELKVSSLTLVYVSAYIVSAVTVLLRIQLHILGKSMEIVRESQLSSDDIESGAGPGSSLGSSGDDVFKILIEGTYKHIFGSGLYALSEYVRPRVMECFADWNVRDNLAVDFNDLAQVMSRVHRNIERDSTSLAKMIMLRKYCSFLHLIYHFYTNFFSTFTFSDAHIRCKLLNPSINPKIYIPLFTCYLFIFLFIFFFLFINFMYLFIYLFTYLFVFFSSPQPRRPNSVKRKINQIRNLDPRTPLFNYYYLRYENYFPSYLNAISM